MITLPATASAGIAEDHDGGGGGASFAAGPALAEVGAAGLLADSVELEFAELLLNLDILLATGDGLLHPLGLGKGFLLGANLNGVGEVGEDRGFEREAGPETLKGLGEFGGGGGEESTNRGNGFEAGLHGSLLSRSSSCLSVRSKIKEEIYGLVDLVLVVVDASDGSEILNPLYFGLF